ncbi:mycothiol conjugate amidase Mca [Corynebacterium terpenotabidum]|uniref:Mycothiol S-conjugate amidase n=1 Tax=Corynebacterium terpenotabidum Y-11 TaxID=1200352 RepID=S4XF72_9CORY|nr:mycothiol conjugate amidase Mca [Corynebacterium terpenotabidum]AGP31224.1 mycothiol conjugate amidase Mca [Corynebacterium terpenotabidum Y-11]
MSTPLSDVTSDSSAAAHAGLRLLAIHAHPDDESSKGAATMARYADEGCEVMVLTCTGGERGSILNPQMDRPGVAEHMHEIRIEEMAQAAEILGVQHRWLGYIDSGLPEGDPLPPLPEECFALADTAEATAKVVAVIREFRPHVIITYDENGGYPHPDHIKTHAVSMRAWDVSGDPDYRPDLGTPWTVQKLYYTHGFIRRRFELLARAEEERGNVTASSVLERWNDVPDIMPRVTTQIACAPWFARRDAALRAHATQIDPDGPFFAVATDIQENVWPTEEFELAASRVETTVPEDDLFAGVVPD